MSSSISTLSNEELISLLHDKHHIASKGLVSFLSTFKIGGSEFAELDFVDANFEPSVLSEYNISAEDLDQLRAAHKQLTTATATAPPPPPPPAAASSSSSSPITVNPFKVIPVAPRSTKFLFHSKPTIASYAEAEAFWKTAPLPLDVDPEEIVFHIALKTVNPYLYKVYEQEFVKNVLDGDATCLRGFEFIFTRGTNMGVAVPMCLLDIVGKRAVEKVWAANRTVIGSDELDDCYYMQVMPGHATVAPGASERTAAWTLLKDCPLCIRCRDRARASRGPHQLRHCPLPPLRSTLAGQVAVQARVDHEKGPPGLTLIIQDALTDGHSESQLRLAIAAKSGGCAPSDIASASVVHHKQRPGEAKQHRVVRQSDGAIADMWIFVNFKAGCAPYARTLRLQDLSLDLFDDGLVSVADGKPAGSAVSHSALKGGASTAADAAAGGAGTRACFTCGGAGHISRDCPRKGGMGRGGGYDDRRHDRDGSNDGYGAPRGGGGYGDDRRRDYGGGYDDRRVAPPPPPRDDYRGGGGYRDDYNREPPRGGGYDDRRDPLPPPPRDDYRAGGYDDRRDPPRGGGYGDDRRTMPTPLPPQRGDYRDEYRGGGGGGGSAYYDDRRPPPPRDDYRAGGYDDRRPPPPHDDYRGGYDHRRPPPPRHDDRYDRR